MKLALSLLVLALGLGCSSSARVMSPPRVTETGPVYRTRAVAPETGEVVAFYFRLVDAEDVPANLSVEVSRGGGPFVEVGEAGGGTLALGGDGLVGLTAPPLGRQHRLLWKPPAELGMTEEVRFRLTPSEPEILPPPLPLPAVEGTAVTSAPFTLEALQPEPG